MYVCMYVCMYVYMYVCIYVCMYGYSMNTNITGFTWLSRSLHSRALAESNLSTIEGLTVCGFQSEFLVSLQPANSHLPVRVGAREPTEWENAWLACGTRS